MEASVFLESVEEINGCIVTGVRGEAVQRFGQDVVEDDCFREIPASTP